LKIDGFIKPEVFEGDHGRFINFFDKNVTLQKKE